MNNSVDLTVDVCGVRFKTPLVLASGFMGVSQSSLSFIAKHQAGGVTTKSIGHIEREGYSNPTVLPWSCGLINAVGLSNPGVDQSLPHLKEMIVDLKTPLIISFFADTIDNFVKVAEKINSLQPQFMELNASCPNTKSDFGVPFALDASELRKLVAKVRKKITGRTKLIVKLAPNVPAIGMMGKIAEDEGADAISAINTIPGMLISVPMRQPILTNKTGGISGRAIKPVALKAVYDLYKKIKIPIIGIGGIETGEDVLEMVMAGASLVGIGSAIYSRGLSVFSKITAEMKKIMGEEKIHNLQEIKGVIHE